MSDMTSNARAAGPTTRPAQATWAVLLLVLVAAIDITGPLLPGSDGEVVFGAVAALLTLIAAAGLWAARRWGYVMTIVVAGLTVLLALPPLFVEISPALKSVAVVQGAAAAAVIVLAARPATRDAYR